jgi:hypothetical protein
MLLPVAIMLTLVLLTLIGVGQAAQAAPSQVPVAPGMTATVSLLTDVTSRNRNSYFAARLNQPLLGASKVLLLPVGTIFEGHTEAVPARRLNRAARLRLVFEKLRLPDGSIRIANLSLAEGTIASQNVDSEGVIRPRLSKKRLLVDIGVGALIAKLADDISEVASASVSKNKARLAGAGAVGGFILLQRGTNVKIPAGTPLDVVFNRPAQAVTVP